MDGRRQTDEKKAEMDIRHFDDAGAFLPDGLAFLGRYGA